MYDTQLKNYFLHLKEIDYVIAYGSYGRGEESYIVDGDKKLYNDIDLILVVNDKNIDVLKIKYEIKSILNVRWVDILVWTIKDFSKKRNTIFYYDLMSSYKLLKGNEGELLKFINNINDLNISSLDVYDMFLTRGWSLLSLYSQELIISEKIHIFKSYQCAKLIISMVDFVLLSHGRYTSKIVDKLNAIKLMKTDGVQFNNDLIILLEKAILVKFDPQCNALISIVNDRKVISRLHTEYFDLFNLYLNSKKIFTNNRLLYISLKYKRFIMCVIKSILGLNITSISHYLYKMKVIRTLNLINSSSLNLIDLKDIDMILNEVLNEEK